MSRWESIELVLARLYSVVIDRTDSNEALAEYGKGRIFRDRLAILRKAMAAHFVQHPSQRREARFDEFVRYLEGFANRRNDVAHGIVFPLHNLTPITERFDRKPKPNTSFGLIPPLHTFRRHNDEGLPAYVYTVSTLKQLNNVLDLLHLHLENYRQWFLPPAKRRPQQILPPLP